MKQPKDLTICNLEVLVMPNGEILCQGDTIGWFKNYKKYLSIKPKKELSQPPIFLRKTIEGGNGLYDTLWLCFRDIGGAGASINLNNIANEKGEVTGRAMKRAIREWFDKNK